MTSPLSLLIDEEQRGDGQAREVLLLSYSADLGFFETFALGLTRACGARTALISDARMTTADPRQARLAGRAYIPGQAHCSGAFHPKLVVIAGPQRAVVAVGSGNVTLPGWQSNAELWTVHHADTNACPVAVADLAGWLRALPGVVLLSRGSARACADTADQLDILVAAAPATDPQVRLVSSIAAPIIESLPRGPVDELAVCAPFHDPGAAALRALKDRLLPRRLKVSYQPQLTQLDQPALVALTAELAAVGCQVEITTDLEERYRHGKLIEWSVEGQRWALTGSPNLSRSALLKAVPDGGNCELGTIAPVSETLLPAGKVELAASMRATPVSGRRDSISAPVILGATRLSSERLHLQLVRPLSRPGVVEVSPAAAPPESWEPVSAFPPERAEQEVAVNLPANSRVRVSHDGTDGQTLHSNIVYVLEEGRARQRPGVPTAGTQVRTQPVDLFTDTLLAERFVADMVAFTSGHPAPAPRPASSQPRTEATTSTVTGRSWQDYLDQCAGRIGQPLLRFALGLYIPVPDTSVDPAGLAGVSTVDPLRVDVDWLERAVDDREAGLSSDTSEEAAAEDLASGDAWGLPDLSGEPERIRRAYQRYAARLVVAAEAPKAGVVDRLLVTRMVLWIAAAGAWRGDPERWVLLSQAVCALASSEPGEAEPQVASLAAVVLSVLRSEIPRGSRGDLERRLDRAADTVGYLLPAADPNLIAGYTQLLEQAFGLAVRSEVVLERAADVVQDDPVEDALWTLRERGRDAHRHGHQLLHVIGKFPNPALVALGAVGDAEESSLVAAWAGNRDQSWALCIWERPELYVIEGMPGRTRWRHYRLTSPGGPARAAEQRALPGYLLVPHGPQNQRIPEAVSALTRLSLLAPHPPVACSDDP